MNKPKAKPTSNNNASSLYNRYSMYVAGGTAETANKRIEWWERNTLPRDPSDIVYAVENFYEGRLDYISSVFYNESRWWWLIGQYNAIIDPLLEVVAGRILLIPKQERLPLLLASKRGGIDSTRQSTQTISPIIT